ncbi:hypothetical protein RHGRI_035173 [Rhododendron griersonianum]|uniref:Uncharacterized protein n=1 Tax=Rhododendron griersonianum TaxID=479676 RepID=A0AAV6I3H9_9ERIC|nr:hypothetical protein RHGRI_035173 [Rhododendron griersonianum]
MSQATSTSTSASAGASSEDIFRLPATMMIPGDSTSSSASTPTQAFHFSSGNPRIEETRGVMHLYRDDFAPSSPSQLPVGRKTLVCVLGVPNHMTYADFCQFCGSFIQHILEMRIVRNDGVEDKYSVLIRFDDQSSTDAFYKHFNGRHFSSLEVEACHVLFTFDVQYTGSIEHAQSTPASSTEQPSCVRGWTKTLVEFSQLSAIILSTALVFLNGQILLARYADIASSSLKSQFVLFAKLLRISGFVFFVVLLVVEAIPWYYVASNLQHSFDINLQIISEYNDLLTTQLENQKIYFETLIREVEEETEREISEAIEKAVSGSQKLQKMQAKLDRCVKEKGFLDELNENLLKNQEIWKAKMLEIEAREKKALKVKDNKVQELEEQAIDNLFHKTKRKASPMDDLPDQLVWDILGRIKKTTDRNSASLACKRLYHLDNEQRKSLRVGCGLDPANQALTSLCNRFPTLTRVDIVYSGWMSKLGKQLDDQGLLILSNNCPCLTDLTLSYCTFITNAGLTYLSSCSNLSALKLIFTPRINGCGILSLVVGCKNLKSLHLIRCLNVSSVEWLEYLGKLEVLEDLSIKNCRAIGEGDLIKLGPSWRKLKRLQFEVDANYMKLYDRLAVDRWLKQWVPCESMEELNLVNCIISPGRGLACVMAKCKNLEKIRLDMCVGLRDCDIIGLARKSSKLRSISLRVPSDFSIPPLVNDPVRLTDESLKAIAENCTLLESVRLSISDGEFPSFSSFTLNGILTLIKMCPIRELSLDHVYSFNDDGMEALCSADYLETLELARCQEISDDGLQHISRFPQLRVLRLNKCLGVTDDGLKPLVGSYKLDSLVVEDCPQISERGVQGVAKSVTFKQDLSWMY